MSTIFRLRPSIEFTLDELKNNYLWFSRPTEYKDIEDSNIIAFAETNEKIKESFNRVFSNYVELGKEAGYTGICCFTETLPDLSNWNCFPKGVNGIFIEYDKNILEEHFINTYFIGDCFKKVEYLSAPLIIESSSDYDILWEIKEDGIFYESLWQIEHDEKLLDKFFLKLFTRINEKYKKQKEVRVILGNRNIPFKNPDLKGYQIQIPNTSLKRIFVQPNTPEKFVQELRKIIPIEISIVKLT